MHFKRNETVRLIIFYLFTFFIAVYFLSTSIRNFYNTEASQLRFQVTKSIVERFDLSVPEGTGMRGSDGREYSWLGVGSAILAVPFYIAGKLIGGTPENAVSVMNQIFGAATVVLVFLFSASLGYSRRASVIVSFLYGLCTMAWPLAKSPFDHNVETFFVLLSVYLIYLRMVDKKISYLVSSAISLGIAFITRPISMLIMPCLFIFMIIYSAQRLNFKSIVKPVVRDTCIFSLSFLPFLCLNFYYNYYRFGSIFETGYSLIALRAGINFFKDTSFFRGLSGFLISPGKGFFYYSPVAVLFFFSIRNFTKKHLGLGISFIFIIISYLFLLSKYLYWHGDWAWGPRYLLVITPFLIIPIAELFESGVWSGKRYLKAIALFIFALSLIIQIAAVSVDFQKYFVNLRFEEKVEFTVAYGKGVQPIAEPPTETYFSWRKSPILSQLGFIYKMAKDIKDYRDMEASERAALVEPFKRDPGYYIFDFWWLYKYFLDGNYSGFITALILLLIAIYAAVKLWKVSAYNDY